MSQSSKPPASIRSIYPEPLAGEPWIDIPDAVALADWGKAQEIEYNQHFRYAERLRFFALTFDFLKENGIVGDYFEFGCHRVRTFRMALTEARRHDLAAMRFLAFDSFEGLPAGAGDHDVANWTGGALCTSEDEFRAIVARHGIYVDRIDTIKGFYENSLTDTLRDRLLAQGYRVSLLNIDCDLYESAVPIFRFVEPFLQEGSVIYIDDYFAGYKGSPRKGVSRAFDDFRKTSRFTFVQHLQAGWNGRSFIACLDDGG
jgi:hypothetical protein